MVRVSDDFFSTALTATAILLFIFSGTFSLDAMVKATFVIVMSLSGLVLRLTTGLHHVDQTVDLAETRETILWLVVSFGAIFILNLTVPVIPRLFGLETANGGAVLGRREFAVLIADAEENLFRGFFTPFMAQRLGIIFGSLAAAGLFTAVHLAVYGTSVSALGVVFGAGFVLSYAALKTRRLSGVKLAHMANNALAVG